MKNVRYIGAIIWLLFAFLPDIQAHNVKSSSSEEQIDVNEIVFGHIGDSYEWHITDIGETSIAIPLPVIVKSSTGWHIFLSSKLKHGDYEGLSIAFEGENKGKIVETDIDGNEMRPLDISVTKNVMGLLINSAILVSLILFCARWYRRHSVEQEAPKGIVGIVEACILAINDDVIKGCIGKDYKRYAPYLLTVFFFILINNLMGLIPIFPGGANITGNIAITFVLAICTFLAVNLCGNKEYWKEILWPDVPWWLKAPFPMMPIIEIFGIFTKPFALMIRLFANIMAGHAAILSLLSIIFITAHMGSVINGSMSFVAVAFGIFMTALELLVAFIQAYVFTMLSAVFIGLSRTEEAHKSKEINHSKIN